MSPTQAEAILVTLTAAFPRTELPPPTIQLYLTHLEPLPYEQTKAALDQLVMTARFFPVIAEVLEAAGVVGDDGRQLLREAIALKKPLVRDAASPTGWAVGRAVLPPEANAAQVARLSPPAGPPVGEAEQEALKSRLLALADGLRGGVATLAPCQHAEVRREDTSSGETESVTCLDCGKHWIEELPQ